MSDDAAIRDQVKVQWVVIWFPPYGDAERHFADESRARRFATSDGIAKWNPLLERRITTVVTELMPL